MTREKYLADIDKVLTKVLSKESKTLAGKNMIPYTNELETSGLARKVAFDVYKVDNDPYQGLWFLQEVDGAQHLVRANDPTTEPAVQGDWSAISDHLKENITLAYKDTPIARFSSDVYGFRPEDIITFKSALLDRISRDSEFISEVLAEQPKSKRQALEARFPELKKNA